MARLLLRAGLSSLVVALVAGTSGCFSAHDCKPERCDGKDNDCDGVIDNGFVDVKGRYVSADRCGACNVSCKRTFPTAASVTCALVAETPTCRITSCPAGQHLVDDASCAPESEVLCMPCESDADCALFADAAECARDALGGGRCGRACSDESTCPAGFSCLQLGDEQSAQCHPDSGNCSCSPGMSGAALGCILRNKSNAACAGVQQCGDDGLGACQPALSERCNGSDDDCDDKIDEDFVDAAGHYSSADNCGACGQACVSPGPHMSASCVTDGASAHCDARCDDGFVDVDGLQTTGCECRLQSGPGVVIGADANCDGVTDPTPDLIFVAQNGNDDNDGQDVMRPVRTIGRGLERGQATGRNVLVARGIYEGPVTLVAGVSLFGGYSPDFREHDIGLHPVLIEASDPGVPALRCQDLNATTVVDGLTIEGSDASVTGGGSTAVYLDGCGDALTLSNLTVVASRGAPGQPGKSSSDNLAKWNLGSLTELAGMDATAGGDGNPDRVQCVTVAGGAGGAKTCVRGAVSGGNGGAASCPDLSALCVNGSGQRCGNAGCTDYTDGDGVCDLAAAKAAAIANPSAQPGAGSLPGRAGDATYAAPTNRNVCTFCDDNPSLPRSGVSGGDGAAGVDGDAGQGCGSNERLDFGAGRISAQSGGDGSDGSDGSGGGGASAGAGFAVIGNTMGTCNDIAGGSGGGGGSGGCGAPAAFAGTGGGASIGVLVRLATGAIKGPSFDHVRVVTNSGGDGGAGGIGAAGGNGGSGAQGGAGQFFCARNGARGGDGGPGGAGGGGGGGCGGGSYGIVVSGSTTNDYLSDLGQGARIERAGIPGRGGMGGFSPGKSGGDGLSGAAIDIHSITP